MYRYKVRTQMISSFAQNTWDYHLESSNPLEEFAAQLVLKGFLEPNGEKWIMPASILWIEEL